MTHVLRYARPVLALLAGLLLGSAVNMGLLLLGGWLIPPPSGADATTMEGLRASLPLFRPVHFLFPFLAHALGTLAGACAAAWAAGSGRAGIAYLVGGCFFVGGVINCALLPAPFWFMAVDLLLAYFPMAWLARRLGPAS